MARDVVVESGERLAEALAGHFASAAGSALARRGRFACALTGGSVATTFFPRLAACALDWSRVEFFWGDERAVPPDDPESNYGLARRLWLDRVEADPGRIHRMAGESNDLDTAAAAYAIEMTGVLGARPVLDHVLLGVGPDGHVCSLFPGHPALGEAARWVLAVHDSPKPPPGRITLTLPALALAEAVAIVALGEAKAEVLRQAIEVEDSPLPVARVARATRRAVFFLDPEAAGRLLPRNRVG